MPLLILKITFCTTVYWTPVFLPGSWSIYPALYFSWHLSLPVILLSIYFFIFFLSYENVTSIMPTCLRTLEQAFESAEKERIMYFLFLRSELGRRTSCVLFLESSREGRRHIQKDGGSSSPPKALKSLKILYDTSSFREGGLSPGSRSLLRGMRTSPLERRNLGKCLSTVGDLWMEEASKGGGSRTFY